MFLTEFLRRIFEVLIENTGSIGTSIVLLSLIVFFIMIPLFIIDEILQNLEKQRLSKFQHLLDEIKDIDNKQEKHYYTKEIYRKNNYHPLYSLTSLVGIVIQIPFFIAIYLMISQHPSLKGVSFGIINDLSKPDGLINFNYLEINLLPILMGFVSIFPLFIYSTENKEKIQSIVVSLTFTVLLYKMPSALVLYWTLNNVYGLGKKPIFSKFNFINRLSKIASNLHINYSLVFLLLFSLFPFLSYYDTNFHETHNSSIAPLIIIILITTYLIYRISKLLFKNDENKILILSCLFVAFLNSYGVLRELVFYLSTNPETIRIYKILIILIFILLFVFVIFNKRKLDKLSQFFKILSITLFCIVTMKILFKEFSQDLSINDSISQKKTNKVFNQKEALPNIYFIVLDGYANSKILNDVFDYNNSDFETFLNNKGFYTAYNSRSNYLMTHLSLSSTLNMDYLNDLKDKLGPSNQSRVRTYEMIRNNKVSQYLKNKGYTLINIKSGWGVTNFLENSDFNIPEFQFLNDFTYSYLQNTFFKYLMENNTKNIVLKQFESISKLENINVPYFLFAHIVSPHPPYVLGQDEESPTNDIKMNNDWGDKKKYLNQLKFINSKTKKIIDDILKNDKKSIIILQSDHGTSFNSHAWEYPPKKYFIQERSLILNSILLNDYSNNSLHQNISSVNTFRVIFNSVFDENFEILNDSTYFSNYERPYDFVNVTKMLSK